MTPASCQQREKREVQRLHRIVEWVEHDDCQTARLCQHFGETLNGACGHCSHCLDGQSPQVVWQRIPPGIDSGTRLQLQALQEEHPGVLSEPRIIARFLCGITSPHLTRARLTRHELFGHLEGAPFHSVMHQAEDNHEETGTRRAPV